MSYFDWNSDEVITANPTTGTPEAFQPARELPEAVPAAAGRRTRNRNKRIGKGIVALSLCCALLGGAVGAGGSMLFLMNRTGSRGAEASETGGGTSTMVVSGRENASIQVVTAESGSLMTASQVYEQNVNSTVGITTEISSTNAWGYQVEGAAAGSGFILTDDGYILTNQHVIENANSITVTMYDGSTYPAELIGYDTANDIAVLKIEAADLVPVVLGDSDSLRVGDDVIAIGNPLGELSFSLTKGAVSALERDITLSSGVTMTLIQTDCAINSGNSGGALFNLYGEVVGITNAKYSTNIYSSEASIDNIGFAIPINQVRDIVTSIIEKGYIAKPYIGVTVSDVSEESQSYGAPKGAAIRSVEAGSPAEKAGLQSNDIITAVNGETITSYKQLSDAVSAAGTGGTLELTVYRQGETLNLRVTVGERQQAALPETEQEQPEANPNQGSDPWGGNGGMPWGWSFGG